MFDFTITLCLEIIAILTVTSVVQVVASWIFKKAFAHVERSNGVWGEVILYSLSKPTYLLIWVIALSYFMQIGILDLSSYRIFSSFSAEGFRTAAFALVMAWFSLRFVVESEKKITSSTYGKSKFDKTTAQAISRLLKILVVGSTFLVILQTLGVDTSKFLTLGAAGTLVVGLGSKDVLANLFGGFMIYFDRPFKVGDWISSPDKDIEGTVEYIGWRLTRIRNFEKRPIYVPNSLFNNISIVNPSRMTNRRIKKIISIRYDDVKKIPVILADIKRMLSKHEDLDTKLVHFINVESLSESSVDCRLYVFTKTTVWTEYVEVQQDVLLRCVEIVEGHGAQMAFPTTTMHVPDGIKLISESEGMAG